MAAKPKLSAARRPSFGLKTTAKPKKTAKRTKVAKPKTAKKAAKPKKTAKRTKVAKPKTAKKAAKPKKTAKRTKVAKKVATSHVKATPADMSDRDHLISVIQAGTGASKKAAGDTLAAVLNAVAASLKKNQKVQLVGFGTFDVVRRRARKGRNPATGAPVRIKASKGVRFKAGQGLKNEISNGNGNDGELDDGWGGPRYGR